MYNNYIKYLNSNNKLYMDFKTNRDYNGILEHVLYKYGLEYLELITNEYSNIELKKIKEFCKLNDKYGKPNKEIFNIKGEVLICSPTSLRYIYHSLLLLDYMSKIRTKNIVEIGCGYGGLCLAINYFMDDFNIEIDNYHIIDLDAVCKLIKSYLELHNDSIKTKLYYHLNDSYGEDILDKNLFMISNYCYTEIDKEYNKNYNKILVPKIDNGFIIWQNGGNKGIYPIDNCENILKKNINKIVEERPQTDSGDGIYKNYFVYF